MKRFVTTTLLIGALVVLATPVAAQTIDVSQGAIGGIGTLTVPLIVAGIIRILVIAAAVLFFIWLILGGIKWITSSGDKAKNEEARNQITAALVGLVIVFSAWAIARLAGTLFGIDFFRQLEITSFQGGSTTTSGYSNEVSCIAAGKGSCARANDGRWYPR